jgi:hypothetical protein
MTRTLSLLIFTVICAGCLPQFVQNRGIEVTQFRYQQRDRVTYHDVAFEITLSPGVRTVAIQVAYIDADGNATIHPGNLFEYTIPDYRKSAQIIDAFSVTHAGIVRMYIVKNQTVITRIDIPVAFKPA